MSSIETMSHVDLLDAYDESIPGGEQEPLIRAEVLRRMDSARTSSRDEIEPDKGGYQR